MEDYNYDEDYDSMSEEQEDVNMDIKSEDDQNNFNNNLIKTLKSEKVKTTIIISLTLIMNQIRLV